ncbi:unnamed protein product [Amoebophrya sp. A25]|nr:unnamed protein product [Amoebophrya sp. A25]|eukprot:GSA25T00016463001.1
MSSTTRSDSAFSACLQGIRAKVCAVCGDVDAESSTDDENWSRRLQKRTLSAGYQQRLSEWNSSSQGANNSAQGKEPLGEGEAFNIHDLMIKSDEPGSEELSPREKLRALQKKPPPKPVFHQNHENSDRRIPWSEIVRHNTRKDLWMVLGGCVYDCTAYMATHPGGKGNILQCAGKDGTELYMKAHAWVSYPTLLDKVFLGRVEEGVKPPAETAVAEGAQLEKTRPEKRGSTSRPRLSTEKVNITGRSKRGSTAEQVNLVRPRFGAGQATVRPRMSTEQVAVRPRMSTEQVAVRPQKKGFSAGGAARVADPGTDDFFSFGERKSQKQGFSAGGAARVADPGTDDER